MVTEYRWSKHVEGRVPIGRHIEKDLQPCLNCSVETSVPIRGTAELVGNEQVGKHCIQEDARMVDVDVPTGKYSIVEIGSGSPSFLMYPPQFQMPHPTAGS